MNLRRVRPFTQGERVRVLLIHLGQVADGVIGLLSVGEIQPGLAMKAAARIARWRFKQSESPR